MALVIGLTGGIASGKSTVSKMLIDFGLAVIDADKIAHQVVEVGTPAYKEIVNAFGEEIILTDQKINRPMLGSIIFNNKEKRNILNNIVHPAVRKEMLDQMDQHVKHGSKAVILDIPLLYESQLTHMVEKTVLVYVNKDIQLTRLKARNGLTVEEAEARIASQLPLDQKIALADAIIDNNGSIQETKEQLLDLLHEWKVIDII